MNSESGFDVPPDNLESAESLPERLRQVAKFAGGATALAEKSGVPLRSFNAYLKGAKMPVERLVAIARAGGVSVHWLATGELPVHTTERLARFALAAEEEAPRAVGGTLPVVGLAECGIEGWYDEARLEVRTVRPADLLDPDAFGVLAVGLSLKPAGILPGFLCLCSPAAAPASGDVVFVKDHEGRAGLKIFLSDDGEWIEFQGYMGPDEDGSQRPYLERLAKAHILKLAPVVYVKRKL